jgi:hypothetical protein
MREGEAIPFAFPQSAGAAGALTNIVRDFE